VSSRVIGPPWIPIPPFVAGFKEARRTSPVSAHGSHNSLLKSLRELCTRQSIDVAALKTEVNYRFHKFGSSIKARLFYPSQFSFSEPWVSRVTSCFLPTHRASSPFALPTAPSTTSVVLGRGEPSSDFSSRSNLIPSVTSRWSFLTIKSKQKHKSRKFSSPLFTSSNSSVTLHEKVQLFLRMSPPFSK
jgi:hypothetical protein